MKRLRNFKRVLCHGKKFCNCKSMVIPYPTWANVICNGCLINPHITNCLALFKVFDVNMVIISNKIYIFPCTYTNCQNNFYICNVCFKCGRKAISWMFLTQKQYNILWEWNCSKSINPVTTPHLKFILSLIENYH